ncbi:nuclease-related domain-containing protein [Tenuibacillus multivorans]|uniref:Nuclease-related domain-containing protein n=1 Tax=Tenuibacillus multivorans TaxID=237069 RepID=A0A1H0G6R5_9BACI|nr:nuclease-related domain-containing protein [Tenuibacillus multivorans]GEL78720.1 hypothetical protein TMU01_29550 [Tenuibacillus multivorans]SDO02562.1 Nuclease-related domain-containing protein [Tenuibacillus multivorans]
MILKSHEPPHKLLVAESLKKRLPRSHVSYPKVERICYKERAGYYGEKKVDYPLSKLGFKNAICHDLRLPFYQHHFQMDTLLFTPRFLLIIEVKNIPGITSFDQTSNKMIRTYNGVTDYFDDPLIQVQEQQFQLKDGLPFSFAEFPIEHLVVMAHQETILNIDPQLHSHRKKIIPIHVLAQKIRDIYSSYNSDIVSYSELIQLAQKMVDQHEPAMSDLLKQLGIKKEEFLTGVHCPNCGALPMKWSARKWECWSCKSRSRYAHIPALKDYSLLIRKQITRKDFMWFTQLDVERTAKHLLLNENLATEGHTNQLTHVLDYKFPDDFIDLI